MFSVCVLQSLQWDQSSRGRQVAFTTQAAHADPASSLTVVLTDTTNGVSDTTERIVPVQHVRVRLINVPQCTRLRPDFCRTRLAGQPGSAVECVCVSDSVCVCVDLGMAV